MAAHARKRTTQRRTLRLVAAGAVATGLLAGSAHLAGATYVPDVLHLDPDDGHRFNDGEQVVWDSPFGEGETAPTAVLRPGEPWWAAPPWFEEPARTPLPPWPDGGDSVTETDYLGWAQ